MYYLELIKKFWTFNDSTKLAPSSVTLYLYLLKTAHDLNHYQFAISDRDLGLILGINRATVKTAKDRLSYYGLICFSTEKGKPCKYRIVVDYPLGIQNQESSFEEISDRQIENSDIPEIQNLDVQDFEQAKDVEGFVISEIIANDNTVLSDGNNHEIPNLLSFLEYAKTLAAYNPEINPLIIEKYNSWVKSGWKNSSGRSITNWQASLKNILPFLKPGSKSDLKSLKNIPKQKNSYL